MQIMNIPRLPERLECMLYRRKIDQDIEELRPELQILREASHELRASKRFKQILQVVIFPHDISASNLFRASTIGDRLSC